MTPLPPDPYKVLGVSKDAQAAEIRSAHRKLVLKCHPDKVQDPTLKAQKQDEFQKVQEAYELLNDDAQRQKYDDNIRLAELRRQMQKANISSPRQSPKYTEFEVRRNVDVRTAEPRASTFRESAPPPPPMGRHKTFHGRVYDDDRGYETHYYTDRHAARDASFSDKPSKRELEREREKEALRQEKEKERERRKVRKEQEAEEERRRQEKAAEKAAKRDEKRLREKQKAKDIRRDADEKRHHHDSYIETFEDEPAPRSLNKKLSSKKYEDTRERSSHREEVYRDEFEAAPSPAILSAKAYMQRARNIGPAEQPPAAPTPPPAGLQSAYAPPEEDIRRSAARARHDAYAAHERRGSSGLTRERSYRQTSRESLDSPSGEPSIVNVSPKRHGHSDIGSSPPRHPMRTNSMPIDTSARPHGSLNRAQTINIAEEISHGNRGRNRSKLQSQVELSSSEEDRPPRASKHRSSKKARSPSRNGGEPRYPLERSKSARYVTPSYTRRLDQHSPPDYEYESNGHRNVAASYAYGGSSSGKFGRVKTSRHISQDDIQYSRYGDPEIYRTEYAAPTRA